MKFIMCQGLPGSGKSTWTKSQLNKDTVEVNSEEIRHEIGILKWTQEGEWFVRKERDERLRWALKQGKNVISSDLNLNPIHERKFREICKKYGAEFEFKVFDTPIEECIRRDSQRLMPVGAEEVRKIARNNKL